MKECSIDGQICGVSPSNLSIRLRAGKKWGNITVSHPATSLTPVPPLPITVQSILHHRQPIRKSKPYCVTKPGRALGLHLRDGSKADLRGSHSTKGESSVMTMYNLDLLRRLLQLLALLVSIFLNQGNEPHCPSVSAHRSSLFLSASHLRLQQQ